MPELQMPKLSDTMTEGTLDAKVGYVTGRAPRDRAFARELDAEIERMRRFVGG